MIATQTASKTEENCIGSWKKTIIRRPGGTCDFLLLNWKIKKFFFVLFSLKMFLSKLEEWNMKECIISPPFFVTLLLRRNISGWVLQRATTGCLNTCRPAKTCRVSLPTRVGFCSNTNWAHRFRCEGKKVDLTQIAPCQEISEVVIHYSEKQSSWRNS